MANPFYYRSTILVFWHDFYITFVEMKKIIQITFFLFIITSTVVAQKGPKIGYINMEYILGKIPEYATAKKQLDDNIVAWKKEVVKKKNEIENLRKELEAEKPLLTKELIEDTEEEIKQLENELFEYQQNVFGVNGVMSNQKSNLIKPIQDQVFNAIQDIAKAKRFDFIFDKTADVVMLYASQRYDVSNNVVRAIERANRKDKMSKKELKEIEKLEEKEDMMRDNPEMIEKLEKQEEVKEEKLSLLEERNQKRAALLEERKKELEQRKLEKEEQRKKLIEDRKKAIEERAVKKAETKSETTTEPELPTVK